MHRVTKLLSVAALAAALIIPTSSAFAQPTDDFGNPVPTPEPMPEPEPTPTYTPPPPPPPAPEPAPAPEPVAPAEPEMAEPATDRPEGMTIGLGFGYQFPAEIDRIDMASARFRLPSGLTLEPVVFLNTAGESLMDGDVKNAQNDVFLGSNIRVPFAGRGPVDFVGVAGAVLGYSINDPDGGDNNTSTFSLDLNWGVSAEYWYSNHWCFSLTAVNPFISYVSVTQETAANDNTESQTSVGLNWNPGLQAAFHLFY